MAQGDQATRPMNFQVPEEMRTMAERSVTQARQMLESYLQAARAPSHYGTRPTGRQGRSAAQVAARPACSQPGRPRPHPSPGSPGLADGQGSWRGPDPASNEGKPLPSMALIALMERGGHFGKIGVAL